jgi:hypothetical protein
MPKLSYLVAGRNEELSSRYQEFLATSGDNQEVPAEFDPDLVDPSVFGIEVDSDDLIIPYGLKEAGLLVQTEYGELSEPVFDTAMEMILGQVEVLLEVPSDVEIGDVVTFVSTAAAIKASISLLPPVDPTPEVFEAWCERVEKFAEAYLRQPNMGQFVLPVSSYLEYMIVKVLAPQVARKFKPTDEYIIRRFHSAMSVAQANAMKSRVRKVVKRHFGGHAGFVEFAHEMTSSIYETVEVSIKERASEIMLANSPGQASTDVLE